VEAARAGDQGRGFAVVAAEVRNLAQRSGGAAKEIKALISSTVEKVGNGSVLVGRTGEALQQIAGGVRDVSTIVDEISAASQEQAAGIDQVNRAVLTLDEVTQQNAALVEEASAASKNAADLAKDLLRQVSFFTVNGMTPKVSAPTPSLTVAPRNETDAMVSRLKASAVGRPAVEQGVWQEF
jgi:methyl-accepting chemotaxis protein